MRPLTIAQWQAALDVQETLVDQGVHPALAGKLVRTAVDRHFSGAGLGFCCGSCCDDGDCDGGLGRLQMRSVRRDLFPGLPARPVASGEQCVRIQETPGSETEVYRQLDDYRNRGWNVSEYPRTTGSPSVAVYWACPPGQTPRENQNQALAAQPFGAPLYVKERF
jgi:hypothetical protein